MQGKTWIFNPKKKIAPEKDVTLINEWAENHIKHLKKDHIPNKPPKNLNYITDVYSEWVRGRFYLCAKYDCPGPNVMAPNFIHKFARLEYIGSELRPDRYSLYAMRHNGEWINMEFDAPLKNCLSTIEKDSWFTP